ncbi:MAG: pseudaminic acid synthase, partial [Proteobacteria bacterium]
MNEAWEDVSLYDLYKKAYTPWEWHAKIQERCIEKGLMFFSSPFDATSVDFLEKLNVPCFKVASFENTDIPLIRRIARTGKPVIVSTGMATVSEIEDAVNTLRKEGCENFILLKCTSSYPATPQQTNLKTIANMRELFGVHIGLSDHTMGIGVAAASVAFGAVLIEKHFTLSRAEGGVDSMFSLEPAEFKALRIETERAWQSLGVVKYGGTEAEEKSKQYRRSLYASKDIGEGETITESSVVCVRPALGLAPKYLDTIVGMKARRAIPKDTPMQWTDVN